MWEDVRHLIGVVKKSRSGDYVKWVRKKPRYCCYYSKKTHSQFSFFVSFFFAVFVFLACFYFHIYLLLGKMILFARARSGEIYQTNEEVIFF